MLGAAPSGPTARRALDLAGAPAMLDRIARARAKARTHAWTLIEGTPAGFPWLVIAGKALTGWLVTDMDATLVTAHSDEEGAAAHLEEGLRLPPAGGVVFQYGTNMTAMSCGTPTPIRSATGSGTSPPGWPITPASASSRSAPAGPGKTRSSPAGSGSASCQHHPDQHIPSQLYERRTTHARSEPVRTRAPRAPPHDQPGSQTDTTPEIGQLHNQ